MNSYKSFYGSIISPYHEYKSKPNQDSFFFLEDDDYAVFAVADGAGSLKLSDIGANIAVSSACEEALDNLMSQLSIEESIEKSIEKTKDYLNSREDRDSIGCTLVLAVIRKDNQEWGLGIVGDSYAVITDIDNNHTLYSSNSINYEYSNITKLMTSSNIDLAVFTGQGFKSICIATDGLWDMSVENKKPSTNFWTPFLYKITEESVPLDDFLKYVKNQSRIDDDTTLVIYSSKEEV